MKKKILILIFSCLTINVFSQFCVGFLSDTIFNENFGSGVNTYGPGLTPGTTGYLYQSGVPINGSYVISNTGDPSGIGYMPDGDHTGNLNGYMMVVNADYGATEVYRKHITGLTPNTRYVFSSFLANNNTPSSIIANCGSSYIYPNIKFTVEFPTSILQASIGTGNIPVPLDELNFNWIPYGFTFTTSALQTFVDIVITNNAPGGCGNDYVVDDISLIICENDTTTDPTQNSNVKCDLNIPNVFTPNYDGVNDLFDFTMLSTCLNYNYEIYNRWGELIYKSISKLWDGKDLNGEKVCDGTYFYLIECYCSRNKTTKNKGTVNLFR